DRYLPTFRTSFNTRSFSCKPQRVAPESWPPCPASRQMTTAMMYPSLVIFFYFGIADSRSRRVHQDSQNSQYFNDGKQNGLYIIQRSRYNICQPRHFQNGQYMGDQHYPHCLVAPPVFVEEH